MEAGGAVVDGIRRGSLVDICIQAAAKGDVWRVQRRHLQYLPEEAANRLLALLLARSSLSAPQLELFRHSASRCSLDARQMEAVIGGDWLTYMAGFRHLRQLELLHCSRLRDAHVASLVSLASSLAHLSLRGCSGLGNVCLASLAQLTGLQSLDVSETRMVPPLLPALVRLTRLTHLAVGGQAQVADACCAALPGLARLRHLSAWGADVSDAAVPALARLPHLQHLDLRWSRLASLPPPLGALTLLDVSWCDLRGAHHSLEERWAPHPGAAPHGAEGPMWQLQELRMAGCGLAAPAAAALGELLMDTSPSLRLLDLSKASSDAPGCLQQPLLGLEAATALQHLDLSDAALAGLDVTPCLAVLTGLTSLSLSGVQLAGGAGLGCLEGLGRLAVLDVSRCGLGDAQLTGLWRLTALTALRACDNELRGEAAAAPGDGGGERADGGDGEVAGVQWAGGDQGGGAAPGGDGWGALRRLRRLQLQDNHMSGAGLRLLAAGLAGGALTSLDLGGDSVGDKGAAELARLTQLRSLSLLHRQPRAAPPDSPAPFDPPGLLIKQPLSGAACRTGGAGGGPAGPAAPGMGRLRGDPASSAPAGRASRRRAKRGGRGGGGRGACWRWQGRRRPQGRQLGGRWRRRRRRRADGWRTGQPGGVRRALALPPGAATGAAGPCLSGRQGRRQRSTAAPHPRSPAEASAGSRRELALQALAWLG